MLKLMLLAFLQCCQAKISPSVHRTVYAGQSLLSMYKQNNPGHVHIFTCRKGTRQLTSTNWSPRVAKINKCIYTRYTNYIQTTYRVKSTCCSLVLKWLGKEHVLEDSGYIIFRWYKYMQVSLSVQHKYNCLWWSADALLDLVLSSKHTTSVLWWGHSVKARMRNGMEYGTEHGICDRTYWCTQYQYFLLPLYSACKSLSWLFNTVKCITKPSPYYI